MKSSNYYKTLLIYIKRTRIFLRSAAAVAFVSAVIFSGNAVATEGGGNSYTLGVETNYSGLMFGDGFHVLLYYSHYEASHNMDNAGNDNAKFAYFKSQSNSVAARLTYVWPGVKWFGASVETRTALPLVSLDVDLGIARPSPLGPLDKGGSITGIGDLQFAPILLGWHSGSLHQTAGIEGFIPIGDYNVNNNVNIGRHYYQIAPMYAVTWLSNDVQLSAKFRYAFNGKNSSTNYRSGNEFTLEYSGGYQFTQNLSLGLNGYIYRQTTDDKANGVIVNGDGNRGSVNAIGPYMTYNFTPELKVIAKLQSEFDARNRSRGTRLWIQSKIPF